MARNDNDSQVLAAEARRQVLLGILGSDLAVEISAEFNAKLATGYDVAGATGQVIGKLHSALSSAREGPVVLLALAALQVREGYLQAFLRDAAVDLIDTGEAMAAYRPDDFSQRKAVAVMLEQFGELLSETVVQEE